MFGDQQRDQQRDEFSTLFGRHLDGACSLNLDGIIEAVNPAFERLTGLPKASIIGRTLADVWTTTDDRLGSDLLRVITGETVTRAPHDGSCADGAPLTLTLTPSRSLDGEVVAAIGLLTPINTHRPEPDQFDRTRPRTFIERMLQDALDQLETGVYYVDRDWRLVFVNEIGRRMLPHQDRIQLGEPIWNIHPGLRATPFGALVLESSESGESKSVETYSERLGAWFQFETYPTEEGMAVYSSNMTAAHETQAQLDNYVKRLNRKAALLDASLDAIYVRELDNTISFWNRGAELVYGWTAEEAIGKSARELLYSEPTGFEAATEALVEAGAWTGELEQVTRDGTTIIADCRWKVATDQVSQTKYILCINSNITEQKKQEQKSYRAQRLESLGTLAGGIAHDLNNVLAPILLTTQLLASDEVDPDRREMLSTIESATKRGAEMIRHVLTFARGEEQARGSIDLPKVIKELLGFSTDVLPKSVRVAPDIASDLWSVTGDSTQVLQVLMNLVTNARDAMPHGGRLGIRARNVHADNETGRGDHLLIEIEDTGDGIPKEVLDRVFDPFFTTKEFGAGTGLGLSTSLAIARSHGGEMDIYSELGRGSRVVLRLPAAQSHEPLTKGAQPTIDVPRGNGELVLVIDDEPTIRSITQQTLEANGFSTRTAANGHEAITLIERSDTAVDLVFTDIMMPVMDGAAVAAYMQTYHPQIPVVAASGLRARSEVESGALTGLAGFLSKPFTTPELLTAIHDGLHARGD